MPEFLRMPEVAANTTEAVLAGWSLPIGAEFRAQDTIATVETDKAAVDVAAEHDGVLLATLVTEGTEVAIGAPIALLGRTGEQVADVDAAVTAALATTPTQLGVPSKGDPLEIKSSRSWNAAPTNIGPAVDNSDRAPQRTFASPLARKMARDAGIAVDTITGTGPNSRVTKRDVEAALAGSPSFADQPHTRVRRAIATRLSESAATAPHFYVRGTAQVDALIQLRAELNADRRVSLTDLVVKAVAHAHQRVPEMNVVWTPDATRAFSTVDIGVAVATDDGLVTPVLRSVETKSVTTIAAESADLVDRARRKALRQHELEGGTITVTNLGMYGTEEFAAIINPPQAAILAVGAARPAPVVRDGELTVGTIMTCTLSVDHRPVDGVIAARWLREFLALLEHPVRILA